MLTFRALALRRISTVTFKKTFQCSQSSCSTTESWKISKFESSCPDARRLFADHNLLIGHLSLFTGTHKNKRASVLSFLLCGNTVGSLHKYSVNSVIHRSPRNVILFSLSFFLSFFLSSFLSFFLSFFLLSFFLLSFFLSSFFPCFSYFFLLCFFFVSYFFVISF